jgi:uncharacterized protein
MLTAHFLVEHFQMLPHPEGGFYKETYRSKEAIAQQALPSRFSGNRDCSTAIYFLLLQGNFSAFHRIKSDECWHFYAGGTLWVHVIYPNGTYQRVAIGNNLMEGETFQFVVPSGAWFASETAAGSSFSFVGCTVSPGFNFEDFELAVASSLVEAFPQHCALINRLCRQ